MPLSWVSQLSVTERSVLCLLSSVRSCCHSISSLRRTLLSSWWEGEDVALALVLAGLLLRGSCPWFLAAFHRSCVVAVQGWFYPGLLAKTYHCLLTGDWPLGHASSLVLLPSAVIPWGVTVGGSCMSPQFEMLSILFHGNMGLHFFRISRSFLGNVGFFLFLSS